MIERYIRPEMGSIWTVENKFRKWLDVEIAVSAKGLLDGGKTSK